jgi:ATP-dependent RNA helicase DeaD
MGVDLACAAMRAPLHAAVATAHLDEPAMASVDEVAGAMTRLHAGWPAWQQRPLAERAALLEAALEDQELFNALAAEEPAEDDLAVAQALLADPALAQGGALALAAALVRVLRAPLPAPEELTAFNDRPAARDRRAADPRASHDAGPREAPPEREPGGAEGIWFRMDVGRNGNADPRWLLPFLCRRGHVTRQEIGRIRILGRETQFEVAPYAAARFAAAARRAEGEDAHIKVEPMQPVKGPPRLSRRPEAARAYPGPAEPRSAPDAARPRTARPPAKPRHPR